MEFVQYRTGADDEGRRLDKVLRILFPEIPLSNFYSCIRKGLIRVNEKKTRQDYHIISGDVIYVADFLEFSARKTPVLQLENDFNLDIDCIFRNEHILILNKPYDIPVHETSSFKGMTLNQYVKKGFTPESSSLSFTPGPLHRLDRKTTGLIVFSQSIQGAHVFTELLKKHEIKKHYLSVVEGVITEPITFKDVLSKSESQDNHSFHTMNVSQKKMSEDQDYTSGATGKTAVTTISPVADGIVHGKPVTFVEVSIETGRTHQIRSQCAAHGHPLLGDSAYGGSRYDGLFLHAYRLELPYPNALGLEKEYFAPLPERFLRFLEKYLPSVNLSLYNKKQ